MAGCTPIILGIGALATRLAFPKAATNQYLVGMGVALLAWVLVGYMAGIMRQALLLRQIRDGLRMEGLKSDLDEVKLTELQQLWSLTSARLDVYHNMALAHAEKSFQFGQVAAIAGFVVLLVAAIASAFANSVIPAITTGLIGVSAGTLGAYIGATFMRSQDIASGQLREYFRQPLELSRFLAAEILLESLGQESKEAALKVLIEGIAKTDN